MADRATEKAPVVERTGVHGTYPGPLQKLPDYADEVITKVEHDLVITGNDLAKVQEAAKELGLEETRQVLRDVVQIHENDQNFPIQVLQSMKDFLANDNILDNPDKYETLIAEMRVEAALIKDDSAYPEVRAVVDNTDDPTLPCSTIRAWTIGIIYVSAGVLINQLFYIRQPSITLESNVAQLLAYPAGKAWEAWVPSREFKLFGQTHNLNPGKFNKKEHMLITIMANFLPQYFNQRYASQFSYQTLITLGTNFIGYGIAGLTRQFLVYPAHCVWPASLVTIALSQSFHTESDLPVLGPFKSIYSTTRLKLFTLAFFGMFVYFWFPGYIFQALSFFSWLSWIAPDNLNLATITGMNNGLGVNPLPTFDWNVLVFDQGSSPLVLPFFFWWNAFIGIVTGAFVILGLWYTNTYNTGYLPINTPRVFDHFADYYNVSRAIDHRGIFDPAKYEASFLSAGYLTVYLYFFGIYTCVLTWTFLYHRHEIWKGLKNLFRRRHNVLHPDVHNCLMSRYPECPEWWYLLVLLASIGVSLGAILGWPTYTSAGVVFYGIALCLVFVVPVGIVNAITGFEITLNVLAEFIGGAWNQGNALGMNYFKAFGYMVATLVASFVAVSILNFQMTQIPGVCTATQKDHYTCPGINQFFTAAVLWGTVGPKKVFGSGGMYTALLVGFPIGVIVPLAVYFARRYFPTQRWLRDIHPPAFFYGSIYYAPYNWSYLWPGVVVSYLSHIWLKTRHTAFWAKYNYVLSAAFSSGVAIAAIVIFFALQMQHVSIDWWGNNVVAQGCEDTPCVRHVLGEGEYFGLRMGEFH
ncbi:hypothetical protein PMIN04_010238 [Paraphaeosphaeria minitans]